MKFTLHCTLSAVATLTTSLAAEETAMDNAVDNAAWQAAAADDTVIEQVQFGGFRSPFFGRPTLAAASPLSDSGRATRQRQPRQLLARAPSTPRRRRLSRTPDMLGDSFLPSFLLTLEPQSIQGTIVNSLLSVAGGSARAKISDNNKALPNDRVYFNYNHFQNAVQRNAFIVGGAQITGQNANVDRFTLGGERTLFNGDVSLGLRLPLTNFPDADVNIAAQGPAGRFRSDTGVAGNLSLVGKKLLVDAEDLVVSFGLGIELPTGADGSVLTETNLFSVENESLFLQPFLAMTLENGDAFMHSFLQVDVDVGSSPLTVTDVAVGGPPAGVGDITQQTLIHWDTTAGLWLTRSSDATGITGVAAIAEFHLSSAVSSAEQLTGFVPTLTGPAAFMLSPGAGRYTASYVTTGIHFEIGRNQSLRVAGVFPLSDGVQRFFDGELLVQFGRRY